MDRLVDQIVHLSCHGATDEALSVDPAMLRDDRLLIARAQDVPTRFGDHLAEVLVRRVEDAIFDLVLDGVERPDVMAGDANFASLVRWVESDSVNMHSFPFGTGVDPGESPIENDNFRVDLVRHGDDDHVAVVQT